LNVLSLPATEVSLSVSPTVVWSVVSPASSALCFALVEVASFMRLNNARSLARITLIRVEPSALVTVTEIFRE